jgi:SAM-dependent methyltransferase
MSRVLPPVPAPPYPTFRTENITKLNRVILEDQYDDEAKAAWAGGPLDDEYIEFVARNASRVAGDRWLDIGCGSGTYFNEPRFAITHALDANPARAERARQAGEDSGIEVTLGCAEYLPFEPESFGVVTYMHGFFQCRCDYEVFMEVNRALATGGIFIFDLPLEGRKLEFGRSYDARTYCRNILPDFGFELVEWHKLNGWEHAFAFEKVEAFDYTRLHKMQIVKAGNGLWRLNNIDTSDFMVR